MNPIKLDADHVERIIQALLDLLLSHNDAEVRLGAGKLLIRLGWGVE